MYTLFFYVVGGAIALFGIVGILSPATTRNVTARFVSKAPVRLFGLVLLIIGALIYRWARLTTQADLAHALGFVMFVAGGVQLVLPTFVVVLNEWWVERRLVWERLLCVVYFAVGAFFVYSAIAPPTPPPTPTDAPAVVAENGAPPEAVEPVALPETLQEPPPAEQ